MAGSATGLADTQLAASSFGPTPTSRVHQTTTIKVAGKFDGGNKEYYGIGDGGQGESQAAMFEVAEGGSVSNVLIGAPAGDGIHCAGSCTLTNVWWLDVGEDAATFLGTSSSMKAYVIGGGAAKASDKVFQHNGAGTVYISNFQVQDFGKLYRACGNCTNHYQRNVVLSNITATSPGKTLVGINTNWGDTAKFSKITIVGDSSKKIVICTKYKGVAKGSEPTKIGTGADANCIYSASDITYK
jgi:hypothetical protein